LVIYQIISWPVIVAICIPIYRIVIQNYWITIY
jgi:hypothetical protein